MKTEFDIKLTAKDLYGFNMYQSYRSMSGIISIFLAILLWGLTIYYFGKAELIYNIMYVVIAFVVTFYSPLSLWFRCKKTIATHPTLSKTLHYEVSEKGIRVTQEDQEGELTWDLIYKVVSNKNSVLIYSSRVNAYVLPKEQLEDKYEELKQIVTAQLDNYRVKLK